LRIVAGAVVTSAISERLTEDLTTAWTTVLDVSDVTRVRLTLGMTVTLATSLLDGVASASEVVVTAPNSV
jgi:nickel-dependent lactate racemase